jgi:hypothetical protein
MTSGLYREVVVLHCSLVQSIHIFLFYNYHLLFCIHKQWNPRNCGTYTETFWISWECDILFPRTHGRLIYAGLNNRNMFLFCLPWPSDCCEQCSLCVSLCHIGRGSEMLYLESLSAVPWCDLSWVAHIVLDFQIFIRSLPSFLEQRHHTTYSKWTLG